MTYRISYAPPADDTLAKMTRAEAFKAAMEQTLAPGASLSSAAYEPGALPH